MKCFFIKLLLTSMMIVSLFQLSGCYNNESSKISESESEEASEDEQSIQSKNTIEGYINKFNHAIDTQSPDELRKIVSRDGFELIRTFLSGNGTRGAEVSETIDSLKIPENLVFNIVKDEYPISLKTEFESNYKNFSDMKIINTKEKLDWDSLTRESVTNTFGMMINNEEIGEETRVYMLKDRGFCLAQFAGSDLPYSRWAAFKKEDSGYSLRLIILFY